jgi:N,N'-diacetyllegionaminate synthase
MNLIAEFCQNHNGDRNILEAMIYASKENGATHAKIQGLYSDELTSRSEFEDSKAKIYRPYHAEYERLRKLDLSFETEKWFVEKCKEIGLIPMITVFTHSGVDRAFSAGFESIKIASYDCSSLPMIKKVMTFASELVVSTGGAFWNEVQTTANFIYQERKPTQKIALLHARTIYPTPLENMGLYRMLLLGIYGFDFGLSDHSMPSTTNLDASKIAIYLGAKYIERHFTVLDKNATKDGPISITPTELNSLKIFSELSKIDQSLEIESSKLSLVLNCDSLDPSEQEILNKTYYRGRVVSSVEGKLVPGWE